MARRCVLVVLSDLHGGGAQRVVLMLLRALPRARFELHLALVRREGPLLAAVPDDVAVHDLAAVRVRGAARPLVALVRRLRPAAVFSTLYHVNLLLLTLRPLLPRGTRLVIREGITVSEALQRRRGGRRDAWLVRWLYPTADQIVCQCRYMADDLAQHFGIRRERMAVVYNPIDPDELRERASAVPNPFAARGPGPHVLAMGRLEPQKGFDLLIESFPQLLEIEPEARLWILGADPKPGAPTRDALAELARARGVADRVELMGYVENPYPYLAQADLFVLSSRYEGLPNVLLEALALGCPAVALDRPGGTREILELAGLPDHLIPELHWRPEWLRGRAPQPEPDLSAFSLDRAVAAYTELLG